VLVNVSWDQINLPHAFRLSSLDAMGKTSCWGGRPGERQRHWTSR